MIVCHEKVWILFFSLPMIIPFSSDKIKGVIMGSFQRSPCLEWDNAQRVRETRCLLHRVQEAPVSAVRGNQMVQG